METHQTPGWGDLPSLGCADMEYVCHGDDNSGQISKSYTQVCFLVETFSTFDVKELLTLKDPTLEFLFLM